ncbi:hypothetical protein MPTK1_6g14800 [Marchantia polymorpha subsp. ruderalis]|uniref:Transmembrane protein n=2 Tax=Marchantia polymorpha TaxID=3197 RepID=A0AAF6BS42_MARPO|nr:hypothetical protein MARPO_0047s0135 [Marchantia polymorpha]BBN14826.1 hypothetical protein Mp_6g14800 [Marchantia polymorpha subsp. ruderalis]|eukprot:PTQ39171.1 hypothetical protein MARPO_0047s0135 [Marchantia polymorpha]
MELLTTIWRALLFIPVCFVLFLLGAAKGIIVGPISFVVLVVGFTAVTVGLWPMHVVMAYYTIAKTKQLGRSAKVLSFLSLPLPFILWPVASIAASILVGLGYGFVTPLVATFEAVGAGREKKTYHCLVDGTWSTLKGSCTVVRDFTDLAFHSYVDYLADFREKPPKDGRPYDIKWLEVPGCIFVAVLGVLVDVPVMTAISFGKSPVMLLKGWQRLLKDLWGRQGPFLEAVCVPFAGLAIVLWPLVVVISFLCAVLASPFLGLYGAVVVYQERSVKSGLAYIVSVIAQFDEYTNDVLHLSEGSCFPRPKYRSHDHNSGPDVVMPKSSPVQQKAVYDLRSEQPSPQPGQLDNSGVLKSINEQKREEDTSPSTSRQMKTTSNLSQMTLASRSLRQTLQEVKLVQIWDNLFRNMDSIGKELVLGGIIKVADLEEWIRAPKRDKSRLLSVGLPAYSSLSTLLYSAKAGVSGLLLHDGTEVTVFNRPQDRVADWLFEPLLVLKEQLRAAKLTTNEEQYIKNWILTSGDPEMMETWQNGGIEPEDNIRRGELQAMCRRLQGITVSFSRLPTFPRRVQKYIKNLLMFAQTTHLPSNPLPANLPSIPDPVGDEAV